MLPEGSSDGGMARQKTGGVSAVSDGWFQKGEGISRRETDVFSVAAAEEGGALRGTLFPFFRAVRAHGKKGQPIKHLMSVLPAVQARCPAGALLFFTAGAGVSGRCGRSRLEEGRCSALRNGVVCRATREDPMLLPGEKKKSGCICSPDFLISSCRIFRRKAYSASSKGSPPSRFISSAIFHSRVTTSAPTAKMPRPMEISQKVGV